MIPASYAPREPPPDSTKPILGRVSGAFTGAIVDATAPGRRCPSSMKLVAGLILASAALAHADVSFDEYGDGGAPHPARQLISAGCDLDVELRGAVATVELRERIVNPGPAALDRGDRAPE